METMAVLTNLGLMEIAGNAGNPNEYFAKKLQRGEAKLYRAGDLKKAHGMVFPGTEPDSLILCEEDAGRWYLVETEKGFITGFEEAEYIEGFKEMEIEALRTKGFFNAYCGDSYYITGKALKEENVDWADEEKDMIRNLDDNAVYYWGACVEYICQLDKLETASRLSMLEEIEG